MYCVFITYLTSYLILFIGFNTTVLYFVKSFLEILSMINGRKSSLAVTLLPFPYPLPHNAKDNHYDLRAHVSNQGCHCLKRTGQGHIFSLEKINQGLREVGHNNYLDVHCFCWRILPWNTPDMSARYRKETTGNQGHCS